MFYRLIIALIIIFGFVPPIKAQQELKIIIDSEAEKLVYDIAKPLYILAGKDAQDLKIWIYDSYEANAFVDRSSNIFVSTGILKILDYEALAGVLAHEISHIIHGHIINQADALSHSTKQMATIVFAGLIMGALSSDLSIQTAMTLPALNIYLRSQLKLTREQERQADNTAIKLLKKAGFNIKGMIRFFEQISEKQITDRDSAIDPYLSTHPMPKERISYLKEHLKDFQNIAFNKKLDRQYNKAIAKLIFN